MIYKTVAGTELRLDLFEPERRHQGEARPGIVFFHGGGWRGGTPGQFHPHCAYLASRGMVAISAEYRLMGKHGTTPYECVRDGKSAIRWVRQQAESLGMDPERLAAGGGSAGGHVAAAAATLAGFDDPEDDLSVSAVPSALVLFNPVFDNSADGFGHDLVREHWREFSPLHNIRAGAPPTVAFFGTEDQWARSAEPYRARMEEVGSRCDLHMYDGQPHGFFNYRDGANPYYSLTLSEADRFLASLGYLEGEPTLQH